MYRSISIPGRGLIQGGIVPGVTGPAAMEIIAHHTEPIQIFIHNLIFKMLSAPVTAANRHCDHIIWVYIIKRIPQFLYQQR
jgi:hypothetical protein